MSTGNNSHVCARMHARRLRPDTRMLCEVHITEGGEVLAIVNVEFPFEALCDNWREKFARHLNEAIDAAIAERRKLIAAAQN